MKVIDMTGQQIGKWFVLCRADNTPGGQAMWTCICDCGNIKDVDGTTIRRGESSSCGKCGKPKKDKTRQVFDRLTVLGFSHKEGAYMYYWVYCECGNIFLKNSSDFSTRSKSMSCGCYQGNRRRGENHPRYRTGITKEERFKQFKHPDLVAWSSNIKKKFNYTCDHCHQSKSGNLRGWFNRMWKKED